MSELSERLKKAEIVKGLPAGKHKIVCPFCPAKFNTNTMETQYHRCQLAGEYEGVVEYAELDDAGHRFGIVAGYVKLVRGKVADLRSVNRLRVPLAIVLVAA